MCGIAGILAFNHAPVDAVALNAMSEPLKRRGPDGGKHFIEGSIGFAHRRLSIIDLDPRSNQPMFDEQTGNYLVFNGTIYNYKILREQLRSKGYTFKTEGDSEVILKAYAQWGENCVKELLGMFAFAIWDVKKRSLFMARDRLGIKPLYFAKTDQALYFASNTQSILATGKIPKDLSVAGLNFMYSLHASVPAPHTIIESIKKLEPAHTLTIHENGSIQKNCYWNLDATRPKENISDIEWQNLIEEKLRIAVRRRMEIADVPVGILLSGGLDSSLLVALACQEGAKDLSTFSIGFEDQPEEKGSEFEYSDQVVDWYKTQHHKIMIPNNQVLQRLPEAINQMAEPMFAQDAVAFYLLAEQVSQHVKVVQSGQGADEVFAGYFWYPKMNESTEPDTLKRFSQYYFDRDHAEYQNMVQAKYQSDDFAGDYIRTRLNEANADAYIDQVLRLDVTTLIVDDPVKRVDNMTMAHGLEARVPFLDHELVELAAKMPPHLKLQQQGKHVLKNISRGLIPDDIIDRKKGYFPMPALKFVRGEFYDMMRETLSSQKAKTRGIFNDAYVQNLLDYPEAQDSFTRIQGSKLWHCAALEMWISQHLD